MIITDLIPITELSRLTRKSRPTIYKYLRDFSNGNYDNIPYSIINLFKMTDTATKDEIISYCNSTYGMSFASASNAELQELFNLIVSNQYQIDLKKIKKYILEELNNGWKSKIKTDQSFFLNAVL